MEGWTPVSRGWDSAKPDKGFMKAIKARRATADDVEQAGI